MPVQAAVPGNVSALRKLDRVQGVAYLHGKTVISAGGEIGRQIPHEGGEAAAMLADEGAVDVKIGAEIGTVELDEQLLAGQAGRHCIMLAIPADAAVVVIAAVLPVQIIPGVRQSYARPGRVVEGDGLGMRDVLADETPGIIEAENGSA